MARAKITGLSTLFGRRVSDLGPVHVLREDDGATRRMGVAAASELRDEDALAARFGGGRFLLIARDATNMRIAARVRVEVAGEPHPAGEETAPVSRRKREAAREIAPKPHATRAGLLAAEVFELLDQGRSLADVVRATGVEPRVLRAIFLEWLTPLGDELPKSPEELKRRMETKRAERLDDWGAELAARARKKESG